MYILERGMECLPQVFSCFDDDDFYQSMMDFHSPPLKGELSKGDQLSFVSDILLEDHDMQLNWNCAFLHSDDDGGGGDGGGGRRRRPSEEESGEEGLWRRLTSEKTPEEKPASSVLGSSPLLSDMDTGIFEGLAGSTLDCHDLMESRESAEATSDYCSTGGEMSTYSSSDSDEEIDVVTVGRCPSRHEEVERLALQRRLRLDIQLQHNYAAPPPASPPPSSSKKQTRRHYRQHSRPSRNSAETEDEQERRWTHNVMERQRRNEMKNYFARLRDSVPELSRNNKASKAVILKTASDCIRGLEEDAYRLQSERERLRAKQDELKMRLQRLRTSGRW
ncbi:transcriptional regulator Myc-like [Syngnathoides biaculeatus]|uniref:transcriptional regulator Myc-like n=1 Tax=Syngnathoides biaculeatus TaxID=300417 RepID=UPI002ADD61F9|nr:transcriptional regulator Myc-like [Syngnathoides biaculeatus]XP_061687830.1 transcriptional regulator Myc-like [Syngnathoides biaculeatus]